MRTGKVHRVVPLMLRIRTRFILKRRQAIHHLHVFCEESRSKDRNGRNRSRSPICTGSVPHASTQRSAESKGIRQHHQKQGAITTPIGMAPSSASKARLGNLQPPWAWANDWYRPACGDHIYTRNVKCRKCGTPSPSL